MSEGTGFSLTPAAMGQMQARNVGVTAQDELGRAAVNSAAAIGGVLGAFEKMQDYKALTKANLDTRGIQGDMEADFGKRLQAAPGTALSFMNEDGTLNQDKVDGFAQEYKEKFAEVQPSFWDMTKRAEWEAERDGMVQNAMKRMTGQAQLHELNAIKRTGDAALKECELNDDAAGYAKEIRRQVDAGVLTEAEGRVRNLAFGKSRLRRAAGSGGRVRIGGTEYGGLDAAYAAQAEKMGYKVNNEVRIGDLEEKQPVVAGDLTLRGEPPVESSSLQEAQGELTLRPDLMRDATRDLYGDGWLNLGDYNSVLKLSTQQEIMELQDLWDESCAVKVTEQSDGSMRYDAGVGASEAVELVAASGNAEGVPSKDAVEAMVGHVLFGELARDSGLTESELVKTFDKSGAARVLGYGDEEVGKNVIAGMAREAKARSSAGRERLSADDIKVMVDLQVNGGSYGAGEEWRAMEVLNPGVEKDKVYEYPKSDEEQQKRWVDLKAVYKKYRAEYNPAMKGQEFTDEEFAEKAQGFWQWYMGGSNKHKDAKAASKTAGKNWYAAAALQRLMELRDSGEDVGYADELSAVREVLGSRCPLAPAVEKMLADKQELYVRADKQNAARLNGAKPYYEQLLEMKGYEKEHSEAAQKAAAREEDRQRRADEAAEKKERDAAEKREGLRRRVELQTPQVGAWGWNSQPVQGERIPQCQVPKAEYERLVRLGYDGTQRVFLKVGSKEVFVDMSAPAPSDVILMNTAACEYMQPPKPRGKKQVPKVLQGNTDYYFIFKN